MKKIICLLLVLIMVLSVFASCGEPKDNGDESTSDIETGEPTGTEAETTEPEKPLVMKDYNLADFKIVYGGNQNLELAESLKNKIKEKTGVELSVAKGTASNDEGCELIIGNAVRAISTACYDYKNNKYMDSNGILCDNGKVQLLGIEKRTIKESIDYFINNIAKDNSATISIAEEGALCDKINLSTEKIYKKADASDIRIVTNNILQEWIATNTYKLSATKRESRIYELISAYALLEADIMGFQEVDPDWYTVRGLNDEMAKLGYALVPANNVKFTDRQILNPIYYNTDRFTLLDGGYVAYNTSALENGPYDERWYSWAVLQDKTTGKQVIVANTHFIWGWGDVNGSSQKAIYYRNKCAEQLVALIAEKQIVYPNAAGIVMGDLNSYLDSDVCNILGSSLNSARDTSAKKVNVNYDSDMPNVGIKPSRSSSPKVIDHIYYTKTGVTAKRYEVSISPYTYVYSDHVPVLFDFVLN